MTTAPTCLVLCLGVSLTLACGGAPVPTEQLTAAKSSVRAAEEVGARSQPQAAMYLDMARDKTARAEHLIDKGERDVARRILERAHADAELAVAIARSSSMRADARSAMSEVQDLQRQSAE